MAFNAAKVRDGLRTAMLVGQDPASGFPVFVLPPVIDTTTFGPVDDTGVPWDAELIEMQPASGAELSATCAVEYEEIRDPSTQGTSVSPAFVTITILDEDWEPVRTCIAVRISGRTYVRDRTLPTLGLQGIAVYQVIFKAVDLS